MGVLMTEREYLTPSEVATQLRVSTDTVMRWLRTGQLQGEKAGKQWRVSTDTLQAYMKRTRAASAEK